MKKLFTIDDIMVAFISALGYGFGETIAQLFGWPELVCLGASFALGLGLEEIISGICFSKAVQKKPINRVITYVSIFLVFLLAQYISIRWMGVSMIDYVTDEIGEVIVMPVLGFIVNLLIREYRVRKIRRRYGDGSGGFVFDVKEKDVEEINRQNRPVLGEYDESCAVRTKTGTFIGGKYKKTLCFMGIPYAKPPVGEGRWQAPEALPPSDGVFEATSFGPSAIQVEHKGAILKHHRQSEDCLYLNICVGAEKAEEKRPVLVLFHHGDFTYGGAADPLMQAAGFVDEQQNVVLVSFNFRLGIFGFIDFSEVPGGEACPDALNLGLLDQIAALRWIRENIAAFGGDPDQITVLGFESGATSICLLAADPRAKGLFRRAFAFNGSPAAAYDTPDASRALAKSLLEETGTATMEELLRLSTEELKSASQKLWQRMSGPTCDGVRIPADLYQAYREGAAAGIDFILGIPSNEMQVYRAFIGDENYVEALFGAVDELRGYMDEATAHAVRDYLEAQTAASNELEAKSKLAEQWLALGIWRSAARLAAGGNRVHLMYWNEKPLIENLGAGSVDAMAALLGNGEALEMYGGVLDADLSETLQALLLKFISGEKLELYHNEIQGVDAFDWEAFPKALIAEDGKFACAPVADRLTEIAGLADFALR